MVHPGLNMTETAKKDHSMSDQVPRYRTMRRRLVLAAAATLGGCAGPSPFGHHGRLQSGAADDSAERLSSWREVPPGQPGAPLDLPEPPREFRAAWVATVANIDWPSRPGLSMQAQQAEALAILDCAVQTRLNAIVLQVRTSCDALYESSLEPWSEYLSGEQGRHPGYDPLAFWIAQAHARGLELHAWFNPFRARHNSARSPAHEGHVSRTQPQWVHRYGDLQWMDPGDPKAAHHTLAVVADVLKRYAVDGVHIDDYFYPYPVRPTGAPPTDPTIEFPDDRAWQQAQASGSAQGLTRAQWRRRNVDELVRGMHEQVRRIKPQARFGVSPFGIGKPALRPPGIAGFSQYDELHADVERWLSEGWMDYLAPQLYWSRAQTAQAFAVLLDYWRGQNIRGRHVWPGLYTSRIQEGEPSWQPDEIEGQIEHVRQAAPGTGHLHFSMVALLKDRRGVASRLRQGLYAQPALVPATPWLARPEPPSVEARVESRDAVVQVRARTRGSASRLLLWIRREGRWEWKLVPARELVMSERGVEAVALSGLDPVGLEGDRRCWLPP